MTATIHQLRPSRPSLPDGLEEREDGGALHQAGFLGSDEALVDGLLCGSAGAPAALYDRYSPYVQRLLMRVLGNDPELADLLHEVFAEVLTHIRKLKDPAKLKGWLTRVTVYTARGAIRRRRRRRWLRYHGPETMPEEASEGATEEQLMVASVYTLLDRLPTQERLAFSLRRIEGMTLPEAAEAMGVSLATFKRRLSRADERFHRLGERDPLLSERASRSERGRSPVVGKNGGRR